MCTLLPQIVEHQRLSGSGYCFSASLPPYLATSASQSLRVMSHPEGRARMARVRSNAASLRRVLSKIPGKLSVAHELQGSYHFFPTVIRRS